MTAALEGLKMDLGLPVAPRRIEGFDIAHLEGTDTVASLVRFTDGRPDRKLYRAFNIRSLDGKIDDFESIREAVARRYTRVLNEELERPDLIVIDGGKGQLSAARGVLTASGMGDIPVIGLAKKKEEIFIPGREDSAASGRGLAVPADPGGRAGRVPQVRHEAEQEEEGAARHHDAAGSRAGDRTDQEQTAHAGLRLPGGDPCGFR